jgi:hypothetical protein
VGNELFRFYLEDKNIFPSNQVQIEEPIGWDGVVFIHERHEYHGFINTLNIDSIDFRFLGKAKDIIDNAFLLNGTYSDVNFQVEFRSNPSKNFDLIFDGKLNFSKYENVCGVDCYSSVSATESSCYGKFHNSMNKPIELDTVTYGYSGINRDITITSKKMQYLNKMSATQPNNFINFDALDGSMSYFNFLLDKIDLRQIEDQYIENQTTNYWSSGITIEEFFKSMSNNFEQYFYKRLDKNKLQTNIDYNISFDIDVVINVSVTAGLPLHTIYRLSNGNASFVVAKVIRKNNASTYTLIHQTPITPISSAFASVGSFAFTQNFNQNFTLKSNEEIWAGFVFTDLEGEGFTPTSTAVLSSFELHSDFNITKFDYKLTKVVQHTPVVRKSSYVNETLSQLVQVSTSDCLRVKSDYFGRTDSQPYSSSTDGCGGLELLSLGLQVRGAKKEDGSDYKLTADFENVFKNLDKIHCLGYGVEPDTNRGAGYERIRVERWEHFYNDNFLFRCDNPNSVVTKHSDQYKASKIEVGYSKWATNEDGGREDVFATRTYNNIDTNINKTLDLKCDFVASDFATEVMIKEYEDTKTDFSLDNEIFIYDCVRNGANITTHTPLASTTNLNIFDIGSMKNTKLTPIRNLLRHYRLHSAFRWNYFTQWNFGKGEANYIAGIDLSSQDPCNLANVGIFKEDAPFIRHYEFQNDSNGIPLFQDSKVEFEYPICSGEYIQYKNNPYGYIIILCSNIEYKAWIQKIEYSPSNSIAKITALKEQEMK